MQKNGQFIQEDYFQNQGGLNISDSPFSIPNGVATGGGNYQYSQTGALKKRNGHPKINALADSAVRTTGIGLYNSSAGVKASIRAADTKLQAFDTDSGATTDLTEDNAASSTALFPAGNTVPTVFSQFNTATVNLLALAGNTSGVYGAYSATKFTKIGAVTPSGTLTAGAQAGASSWSTSGTYRYAVSYVKRATDAESNAYQSLSVNVTSTTNSQVVVTFSALTTVDTTTYESIKLYRSAVGGADGFTTGDLVATLTLPVVSYTDTGSSALLTQSVPRENSLLDNSVLPAGTYNVLTTWKRRLVTALGSTLYISDINKPESFPTVNKITVPTGGDIKALGIASFSTNFGVDEYLVVLKERELWVVTGTDYTDWELKFVDSTGCQSQATLVTANGYLTWIDYRGIYLWDGSNKPIYCSRPIEALFMRDGDLDKTRLNLAVGQFFRKQNTVVWYLSHQIYGEQKFQIKMDLRLTLPAVADSMQGRVADGVFIFDNTPFPIYGASSQIPSGTTDEKLLLGDGSGFLYNAYSLYSDAGTGVNFEYQTKRMDMGNPNVRKRFHKVVVWVEEVGSWNLNLDWWAGYRLDSAQASSIALPISTAQSSATSLWDVASWDDANWDDYNVRLVPLVFNLNADYNNNGEGDCIQLTIRQSGVDEPVTVAGFSVLYTVIAGDK